MAALLLVLGHFAAIDAQTSKTEITTINAESTFKQKLAQPTQFLQSLGISLKEIQNELRVRARILVVGGFVHNLGLTSFTNIQDTQKAKFGIHVVGAGAARVVGLAAFTKDQKSQKSKITIQLIGPTSARNIGLTSPSSQ